MQSNRLNPAKTIHLKSGSFSTTEQIRTSDRNDLYRLRLIGRSGFNLQLQNLKSAVEATIAFDRNRNGRLDRGETIAQTTTGAIASSRSNLRSGTYWIRISPTGQGDARYRLTLTQTLPPRAMANARRSSNFVSRVLQLTNAFRRQNGLNSLRLNDRLAAAAQQYSRSMATQDFFSHQGRDGSTAQTRGRTAGYSGSVGENLAAGQTSPKAVVQAWIDSAPHRANLLDPRYRDIGIGFFENPSDSGMVNYRYYWTQNFGIPMR